MFMSMFTASENTVTYQKYYDGAGWVNTNQCQIIFVLHCCPNTAMSKILKQLVESNLVVGSYNTSEMFMLKESLTRSRNTSIKPKGKGYFTGKCMGTNIYLSFSL